MINRSPELILGNKLSEPKIDSLGRIFAVSGSDIFFHGRNFTTEIGADMQWYIQCLRAALLIRKIPTGLADAVDTTQSKKQGRVVRIPGIGLYILENAMGQFMIESVLLKSQKYFSRLTGEREEIVRAALNAVGPTPATFNWQDRLPGF